MIPNAVISDIYLTPLGRVELIHSNQRSITNRSMVSVDQAIPYVYEVKATVPNVNCLGNIVLK